MESEQNSFKVSRMTLANEIKLLHHFQENHHENSTHRHCTQTYNIRTFVEKIEKVAIK